MRLLRSVLAAADLTFCTLREIRFSAPWNPPRARCRTAP